MICCNFTGAELGGDIIKAWLDRKQRDVSKKQWDIVNAAISKCNLPLYVKLVSNLHKTTNMLIAHTGGIHRGYF